MVALLPRRRRRRRPTAPAMEPAAILNLATVSVHVPPLPIDYHPPSTSLAQQDASQLAAVDAWISALAASPEREGAYYGRYYPPDRTGHPPKAPRRRIPPILPPRPPPHHPPNPLPSDLPPPSLPPLSPPHLLRRPLLPRKPVPVARLDRPRTTPCRHERGVGGAEDSSAVP